MVRTRDSNRFGRGSATRVKTSSSGMAPENAVPSNFLDLPPKTVPNPGRRSSQQIRDCLPFVIGRPEDEDLRISAAQAAQDDFQVEAGIRLRNPTLFRG